MASGAAALVPAVDCTVSWYPVSWRKEPFHPAGAGTRSGSPPTETVPKARLAVSWMLPSCPETSMRLVNAVEATEGFAIEASVASPMSVTKPWKWPTTREVPACRTRAPPQG